MALCAKVLQFLTKLRFAPRKFLSLLSHFGAGLSIICFYVRVWHNGKARRCGRKPAMPGFAIRYNCRVKAPPCGELSARKRRLKGGWVSFVAKAATPHPLRGSSPQGGGASLLYKMKVVRYKIFATSSSIKLFICSGLSVLELCPAPSIHINGIFVLRCHALLYRMHEPAWSWVPHINNAGHLISYGRSFSMAVAKIRKPCPAICA